MVSITDRISLAESYDGASVMSGNNEGVQQLMRECAPYVYVHCFAHRLNLALVASCKAVAEASACFSLLEHLYVFTSVSLMHIKWLKHKMIYIQVNLRVSFND